MCLSPDIILLALAHLEYRFRENVSRFYSVNFVVSLMHQCYHFNPGQAYLFLGAQLICVQQLNFKFNQCNEKVCGAK